MKKTLPFFFKAPISISTQTQTPMPDAQAYEGIATHGEVRAISYHSC